LYYKIGLECPQGYQHARAGQFVMIHLIGQTDVLLGRPFSIHRLVYQGDYVQGIELLYKIVGEGTRRMAALKAGEALDVLGPLGQGFRIKSGWDHIYMVAGGIGVAPMIFLSETLHRVKEGRLRQKLYLGGRSKGDLLCVDAFEALAVEVQSSTDDGSAGHHGLVTEALQKDLPNTLPDVIFACGPIPMLRGVAGIAADHQIACQVSLEAMMACGMGACLGCACEGRDLEDRYLHVCMDGPVFDAERLRL
jgi:dihydroorotate dehydrogenase electron transfer subunit